MMSRTFSLFQPLALCAFFLLVNMSHAPPPDAAAAVGQPAAPKSQGVNVMVGQKGLTFVPPVINAAVGDKITYTFFAKNHTLTQTTLEEPCTPLGGPASFDSGFIPVSMSATEFPTLILTVNTLKPIYYACVQKMHCELGMVGGLNLPPTGRGSLEDFTAKAKATMGKTHKKTDKPATAPPTAEPGGKPEGQKPPGT
ncbi:hypothetical protein Pst134EA_007070 [Puccinia striiformis f. sp. tritici]|uniref:hypothetical protein n=1 Tax=Puccinia striiformis f. sp. tritici TaxID=168172 RepID=UPI0020083C12|nr:hypothetical protein Pst134EA_007070 [Puccinia striiformis f. sp. tritici]KAH9469796.1 hypothetical protein Pst134EA_007070 [Puccinia striiformis f. sp. tritici]KAI9617356.1 hypothetical protein KEM48_004808 [Puccinia striiformis f. sp. tritici PST-130]